ncbi:6,7-dimethyl-8-ribityllumazine synthase [Pelagophyceae sp. CCMP2097]|nr:6,7-dimethyl-8-ribityllumazine synthase [Pelagophyceae sp. CCMP2097]
MVMRLHALFACALAACASALTQRRSLTMNIASTKEVAWGKLDGSKVRIGIIKARWNPKIVDSLCDAAQATMLELGVDEKNIFITDVPGAWELPFAAKYLAASKTVDAIICLGCLIKGETMHFEYIAEQVSSGIMTISLQTSVPCTMGVLTVLTEEQAAKRSYAEGGDNHGISWGKTAVEMALLRQEALGMTGLVKKGSTINLAADGGDADAKGPAPPKEKIFF